MVILHLFLGNSRRKEHLEQAIGPLQQNYTSVQYLDVFLDVLILYIYILVRDNEILKHPLLSFGCVGQLLHIDKKANTFDSQTWNGVC